MTKKRGLRLVDQGPRKLGADTIMDRALADRYGADYVHLAAFAIDVDRVFQITPDDRVELPFGWEVRLTEAYVLSRFDPTTEPRDLSLLEDACLGILDWRGKQPPLGAQLSFAVYCAVQRGALPEALAIVFESWRKPPTELARDVATLAGDAGLAPRFAAYCLEAPLDPPLVAPVRQALTELAERRP